MVFGHINGLYADTGQVVQEMLLAKQLWLLCGPDAYPAARLYSTLQDLVSRTRLAVGEEIKWLNSTRLMNLLEDKYGSKPKHFGTGNETLLSKCILRYAGGECTNPRDHIYSLVGLLSLNTTYPVRYDGPKEQVLVEFARRSCGTIELSEAVTVLRKLIESFFIDPQLALMAINQRKMFPFVIRTHARFEYTYEPSNLDEETLSWMKYMFVDLSKLMHPTDGTSFITFPITVALSRSRHSSEVSLATVSKWSETGVQVFLDSLDLLDVLARDRASFSNDSFGNYEYDHPQSTVTIHERNEPYQKWKETQRSLSESTTSGLINQLVSSVSLKQSVEQRRLFFDLGSQSDKSN